ncbi:MAG: hypothetical protein QOG80_2550 [Pseudonocardiales bacterium]|jgi:hypothetical protein|nr:hypothetical protein [Pseudonocardiales bacterium]
MTSRAWLDWTCFAAGLALILASWFSVIGTLIVPRPVNSRISRWTGRASFHIFGAICRPMHTYAARDRLLAWQAPFSLFLRLVVWIGLFDVGYALMLLPFVDGHLSRAFDESGSALFTLGYAAPSHAGSAAIVYVAAFSGLVVVALQIGYLPSLYAAFNRREAEVTLLIARGGIPAWGPELLARTRFGLTSVDGGIELAELYRIWERWAAEVAESHTTYLTLCWFRSPRAEANWLISLLSIMDAAAMHVSLRPSTVPALRARLVLRAGFTCIRQIARATGIPAPEDADPDAPLALTYQEFADAVAMLDSLGFASEVTAEQAWPHFRGWRVNYETVTYALARRIDAPPALWSGSRRWPSTPMPPHRPANRVSSDTGADDPQRATKVRPPQ